MKLNLCVLVLIFFSYLNCSEISEREKQELAQKSELAQQLIQVSPPGGAAIVQEVAKQLNKDQLVDVLNKALKIAWQDEELVNFTKNIINCVKKDKLGKDLSLLKFIEEDSEYKEDSREAKIIKEMQSLLSPELSNLKFKYLKPK